LEQIIFNLATNARDAMPEGGTLTIQTSRMHMDDKFIRRHGFGRSGEFVMLTARDTGSGIDPHIIQRIFEPFFTTKEVGKGTGLGLSMVYGIVKQNDGFIDVQSDPGKGTTFSIYFPISALQPSEKRFHTKTRASGGHETILLVEDDNTVREMVRNVLESSGYRILIAKNGEEAMMVFKENRKEIQLLISDVVMPKKGGQEVLTEIRGINPAIKVILLSGYPKEELGRLSNYDAFLPKPLIPDNLLQTLREVLDR
jgi:CheY-like chemotaxis protein